MNTGRALKHWARPADVLGMNTTWTPAALVIQHDAEALACRERTCKCGRALLASIPEPRTSQN